MKLICSLFLMLSFNASATGLNVSTCSQLTQVCASVTAADAFNSRDEGRFELELTSVDGSEVQLIKTDLWMQMGHYGHGSAPLRINEVAPQQYNVTNAYFVMRGTWQIRVTYELAGQQETLIIPVTIAQ